MSELENILNKYSGGKSSDGDASPHMEILNKYSSGVSEKLPEQAPVQITVNKPSPGSYNVNATPKERQVDSPFVSDVKNIPRSFYEKTSEAANAAKNLAGEGVSDIQRSLPLTGIPKTVLGAAGYALSPIAGAVGTIDEFAQKATGNKNFKPAELMITTGLPISKTGTIVSNAMPSTRAIKTIIDTIGPENIPKVLTELKSNPRLTLMDVDPNVQITSMGLAAQPGKPRDILHNAVEERKATEKQTVEGAYSDLMGKPVNIKDKLDELNTNIKNVGKEINPVIANSKPVDVSEVIKHIDDKLKPGITSVISQGEPLPLGDIEKPLANFRKLLTNDKSNRTDAKSLHQLQSALRSKAEDMMNSTNGQDRQIGYALMNVRNKLVDAIDKASPQITNADGTVSGSYKPALAKYRDENDIKDAFTKGQLITRNKLGQLEDRPEYWEEWVKNATPQELQAAREGARDAVAQQMGSFRFAAKKGENIGDIEFNREKLKLLFGNQETDKMLKILSDEKKIADTNSKEFQNSMTAMRLLAAEKTKERPPYKPDFTKSVLPIALEAGNQYLSGGVLSGLGIAAGASYPYVRSQITKIGQRLDRNTNVEISKLASATGESKEALIKALEDYSMNQNKLTLKQKLKLSLPTQL